MSVVFIDWGQTGDELPHHITWSADGFSGNPISNPQIATTLPIAKAEQIHSVNKTTRSWLSQREKLGTLGREPEIYTNMNHL